MTAYNAVAVVYSALVCCKVTDRQRLGETAAAEKKFLRRATVLNIPAGIFTDTISIGAELPSTDIL